jgi:hypothetical protein
MMKMKKILKVEGGKVKTNCKRCDVAVEFEDWDTLSIRRRLCFPCQSWTTRHSQRDSQEAREGWSNPV